MRRAAGLLALLFSLALGGCPSSPPTLIVDLRTDLVPGLEFSGVRTRVGDSVTRTLAVVGDEPFFEGARVAEVDVAEGPVRVTVELFDRLGNEIAAQTVQEAVGGGANVITVVISRSCAGLVCPPADRPEAISCVDGQCVDPSCLTGGGPSCPVGCVSASECPALADCAEPRCVGGACSYEARNDRCDDGQLCHVEDGCVDQRPPMGDAGPSDAGFDGGAPDAGPPPPDAGIRPPLLLHLDFDTDITRDSSGQGLLLECRQIVGVPFCPDRSIDAARGAHAIDLNGDTGLRLPADARILPSGDLTVEVWIRPTFLGVGEVNTVFELGVDPGLELFLEDATGGAPALIVELRVPGVTHRLTAPIVLSQYQHVALTWRQADENLALYVDGVEVGRERTGDLGAIGPSDLFVGYGTARTGNPGDGFRGRVDDLRFYDGLLVDTQIASDAAAP